VVAAVVALGLFVGWSLVTVIVALVVSIYLHELGHYLVARRSGMKVTEFFLGFGPRIWSFRRGEVEYGLKAIPLGAYVRIIGMSNLEPVDPEDEVRSYRHQNYPRRLATVVAGPGMNLLLAFLLLTGVFLAGGRSVSDGWSVGGIVEGSAAEEAGVQDGDRIVAIAGQELGSFDEVGATVDDYAGETVALGVARGDEVIELEATLGWGLDEAGASAIPSSPALPAGTRVSTLDGAPVDSYDDLRRELGSESGTRELVVAVDASTYSLPVVTPVELPEEGDRGFIGVVRQEDLRVEEYSLPEAMVSAGGEMWTMTGEFIGGFGRLFSLSGLSHYADLVVAGPGGDAPDGPALTPLEQGVAAPSAPIDENRPISIIGIVSLGNQVSEVGGLEAMLVVLAAVNLVLAFINLLPLLPFDGGHAAVATYEAVRGAFARRPYRVDMAKLMPVTYAVVAVLLIVGLSSMYLDVVNPVQLP
jgi:RIP metalloprotease RseP